jgi:hypothetical protein
LPGRNRNFSPKHTDFSLRHRFERKKVPLC